MTAERFMRESLSTLAQNRVAAVPIVPQRYGLSVFLRKPLPDVRNITTVTDPHVAITGAPLTPLSLGDLDALLLPLLKRRIEESTAVALHVLRGRHAAVLRVPKNDTRTVRARDFLTPGAWTTLWVDVGPRAHLFFEEDPIVRGDGTYGSTLVLLTVGEGARVTWFSGLVGSAGPSVMERLAVVERDGNLDLRTAALACASLREHTRVFLAGPGASVATKSLFLAAYEEQLDLSATAEHQAAATTSDLLTKGIAGGHAQAVYRGLVRVERAAPQSNGYQRVNTLLLSPKAEVDAVPNLEINTDAVHCSHSATTSHVKPEDLFYLQSRGLSPEQATELVVSGFLRDVLLAYPDGLRDAYERALHVALRSVLL